MIGLKRHMVQVVEHDPAWAGLFGREARAIRDAGGDLLLDVQHVGSTAVAGLPAKPILDVAIAVGADDRIPLLVARLTALGYIDRGDSGGDGGYLLVKESEPGVRIVHAHVVRGSDAQWRNYLAFRDLLRRDVGVRQAYAGLKGELSRRFPDGRRSYTACKHDFIRSVLRARE